MPNIAMITLDALDEVAAAEWWRERLGAEYAGQYPGFTMLTAPGFSARLGFQKVGSVSADKNRVHLDLEADGDREQSVAGFVAAGAVLVEEHTEDPSFGWSVLRDPFGITFCLSDPH
ncbi:glyoxalase [Arthrobacter sp. MYb211]|uniref:VOC family protein n=1 Tax=Micrococcaceae TaxID=1268 RepID=UPI000CFB8081|nr:MULTISPECIES: VOC family protein [unclassified Arthrobacter]PQZ98728.1 glyoxalase [Arthrobacter sp. MYb224]PRA03062.1 glyoxalase [Arthrobacter sp. MYb229]PRA10975.1 glyoxalase [Arthrobacter sp. MYb221]PRB49533.1 glyoxalase [Arthrobacter sp. MYb216]PRC07129.1 glyoxalase [Arthrobacter sp. MYb211]